MPLFLYYHLTLIWSATERGVLFEVGEGCMSPLSHMLNEVSISSIQAGGWGKGILNTALLVTSSHCFQIPLYLRFSPYFVENFSFMLFYFLNLYYMLSSEKTLLTIFLGNNFNRVALVAERVVGKKTWINKRNYIGLIFLKNASCYILVVRIFPWITWPLYYLVTFMC